MKWQPGAPQHALKTPHQVMVTDEAQGAGLAESNSYLSANHAEIFDFDFCLDCRSRQSKIENHRSPPEQGEESTRAAAKQGPRWRCQGRIPEGMRISGMSAMNRRSGTEFAESPKRKETLPARRSVHELRFPSAATAVRPKGAGHAGYLSRSPRVGGAGSSPANSYSRHEPSPGALPLG